MPISHRLDQAEAFYRTNRSNAWHYVAWCGVEVTADWVVECRSEAFSDVIIKLTRTAFLAMAPHAAVQHRRELSWNSYDGVGV